MRFEILLRLFGCENCSGPSRNGPLDMFHKVRKGLTRTRGAFFLDIERFVNSQDI